MSCNGGDLGRKVRSARSTAGSTETVKRPAIRKSRPQVKAEKHWTQPDDGVLFVRHDDILPEPEVSTDEIIRMTADISNGAVKTPEGFDEVHRRTWARLLKQITEIRKRSGVVDIPEEIP